MSLELYAIFCMHISPLLFDVVASRDDYVCRGKCESIVCGRIVDKVKIEAEVRDEGNVIPGLPLTAEAAIAAIDEVENSVDDDWIPLDTVLKEISLRQRSYAN